MSTTAGVYDMCKSGIGHSYARLRAALATVALLAFAGAAHAATPVSGAITANTTWNAAGSPYELSGAVTVESGAFLRIDPGVRVLMGAASSLTIVDGALSAQGTLAQPIVMTSARDVLGSPTPPAPGDWGALTFENGTNDANTALAHVQIRYGSGVAIHAASPRIDDAAIDNHDGAAIAIDLASSPYGRGLSASGNTLNAISVPAGVVQGDVAWRLKGIAYVVAQGRVEIGLPPFGFSPTVLELTAGEVGSIAVNLPAPAPAGGLSVALTTNAVSIASVPSTVLVPAGAHTAAVAVTAGSTGQATLGATASGYAPASAQVTVVGSPLLSLTPSSASIGVGRTATLRVARSSGFASALTVNLSSLSPSIATVPASVSIPATQSGATFDVTGVVPGNAVIRAGASGLANVDATVQVHAVKLTAPANQFVAEGATANLAVTLSDPAPAGGLTIAVSNSAPSLVGTPATVAVAAGATSAQVAVTGTSAAGAGADLGFSAPGYDGATTHVTVGRIVPKLGDGSLDVPQGVTLDVPVTLSLPAPPGGVTIALSSYVPGIIDIAPAQVTIAQGQTSATVAVRGVAQGATGIELRSVDAQGIDGISDATVTPPVRLYVGTPDPLVLGKTLVGSIYVGLVTDGTSNSRTLDYPLTIAVTSGDPAKVSAPTQVTLPANQSNVSVPLTGVDVTSQDVAIAVASATQNGVAPALDTRIVSVVMPELSIQGDAAIRVGPGATPYGFQARWNVAGTLQGTGRVIDLALVDASPSNIVDGFHVGTPGASLATSVAHEGLQVWLGTATSAGQLKIRMTVAGLGTWTTPAIPTVGPRFEFADESLEVAQGVTTRAGLTIRFGNDQIFQALPGDFAVTSADPAKLQIGTIRPYSGYTEIDLIGVAPTSPGQPVTVTATGTGFAAGTLPVTVTPTQVAFENLDDRRTIYNAADDFSVCWAGNFTTSASVDHVVALAIAAGATSGVLPASPILNPSDVGITSVTIPAGQRCAEARVAPPLAIGTYALTATVGGGPSVTSALQSVGEGELHVQDVYENGLLPIGKRLARPVTFRLTDGQGGTAVAASATTIALVNHGPAWVSVPASVVIPQGQSSVVVDFVGIEASVEPIAVDAFVGAATVASRTLLVRVHQPTITFDMALGRPTNDAPSPVTIRSELRYPCNSDGVPDETGSIDCTKPTTMAAATTFAIAAISEGTPAVIPGFLVAPGGATTTTVAFAAGSDTSDTVYAATPARNGTYRVRLSIGADAWDSEPVFVDALRVVLGTGDPLKLGAGLATDGVSVSLQVQQQLVSRPAPTIVQLACANAALCTSDATVEIPADSYGAQVRIEGLGVGTTTLTASASGLPAIEPLPVHVVKPQILVRPEATSVAKGQPLDFRVEIAVPDSPWYQLPVQAIAVGLASEVPAVGTVPATTTIPAGATVSPTLSMQALRAGTTALTGSGPNLEPGTSPTITVTDN